jgi:hypothetical protein
MGQALHSIQLLKAKDWFSVLHIGNISLSVMYAQHHISLVVRNVCNILTLHILRSDTSV